MNNKWIFAIAGLVVGFYICKKRNEKKQKEEVLAMCEHVMEQTNDLLNQAIEGGYSLEDVKTEYNRAMTNS